MNNIQKNFKKEIKEFEKKEKKHWRKEIARDIYTGEKIINYYKPNSSILIKTEKYISPFSKLIKCIRKIIFFLLKLIIWITLSLFFINHIIKYLYENGISNL
jgi:hypothetical protein